MRFKPHHYQQVAIAFLLNRLFAEGQKGAGLFLDPGLGKTAITLSAINALKTLGEVRRVLIVAPLRVVYSVWPAEVEKWGFPLTTAIVHGTPTQRLRALHSDADILLINPEGIDWLVKQNLPGIDLLVLDESTKFKGWGTKRMKAMKKLLTFVARRMILTGTPSPNSLADLFAQIYVLDDGETLGKTITYFRNRFMRQGGFKGRQWIMADGCDGDIESAVAPLVLRLSAEDHLDMPPLVKNEIRVDLPPNIAKAYRKLERELFLALESGESITASGAGAKYALCRGVANGGAYQTDNSGARTPIHVHDTKVDAAADVAEELMGKPVLIAYSFNHDLGRLRSNRLFANAPVIKGGVPADEVTKIITAWNAGKLPVLLAQPQAMAHGLNLQGGPGRDVIWFGLTDSLEDYLQFNARIYRQGVTGQVRIHHVIANSTVDEAIWERLQRKDDKQKSLLDSLNEYRLSNERVAA